jgi:glycosyltransferase involved in cell wall biosynthesis
MITKLVINNFNYAAYLRECIESALNQTLRLDQIIIIDDGSTDRSREIIAEYAHADHRITPVFKVNGGQLSCFNAAAAYIEEEDLVFLLDSDDIYPLDYVENVLQSVPAIDVAFCDVVEFHHDHSAPISTAVINKKNAVTIPQSSHVTRATRCWIGSQTSAMIISGSRYRQMFPCPLESDWTTRADDVIVYTSSLFGAEKLYIQSLGIAYRVHGNNSFYGKPQPRTAQMSRNLKLERLFCWAGQHRFIPAHASILIALDEMAAIPGSLRHRFFVPHPVLIALQPVIDFFRILKRLMK